MANTSILAAFERMWQHVTSALSNKSDISHDHDDVYVKTETLDTEVSALNTSISNITSGTTKVANASNADHANSADSATTATTATKAAQDGSGNVITTTYETKSDAQFKLDEAKSYTDTKTADLASNDVVTDKISTHNTSTSAHNDIRDLITALTTRLNTLADSDDTTLDQMSEVVAYIKSNKSLIEEITTNKVNVADIVNNLTTNVADKPLSAAQGVELKNLIDTLTAADLGLGEVDNTSDADKPVSNAQAAAIADAKKAGTDAQANLEAHNVATDAHADIRSAVTAAQNKIIAKSDLASDVQTSLGKADTALQSYTETDPTVPSWAKASTKPTYTASEVGAAPSGHTHNSIIETNANLEQKFWRGTKAQFDAITTKDTTTMYIITDDDGIGSTSALPEVTTSDNGKFLRVVNGEWAAATIPNAEEASF